MPHVTEAPPRLSNANLAQFSQAETAPQYDRTKLKHGIVHVGVGGFHRAHLAVYVDRLLSKFSANDWSICGVGLTPFDASMRDALGPQDHLYTVIERSARGSSAHIIGSISDYIFAPGNEEAVIAKMADKDTHIVSLTITESGYYYNENTHELDVSDPNIQFDLTGDGPPRTTYGYLTAALARRYKAGLKPFTVMSCDNMQKNGSISRNMLLAFARLKEPNMAAWLSENGAFPNSMVDRITPRTVDEDKQGLKQQFGIEDAWPVVTEPFMQWVLEDNFSDGRPQFEDVGVQVVPSVRDVEQFELMKLRLLNGGHVAMGYLASLAGFTYVHEVIADPLFSQYLNDLWYEEVKPLLPSIPGVDVDEYIQTLHSRFSNPTLKDEVARICLGGSGKMPQFILPSIAEQIESRGPIGRLTLCVAAWFRYLSGIDENGKTYKIDDPMAKELQALAREGGASPNSLLGVQMLFGDDLRYDGRFVREITMAMRTLDRRGARKTLEKYVELPEDDKVSVAGSVGSATGTHTRESSRTRESRTREDISKRMQEEEIASLRQQVIELTLEKKRLASKLNDIWKMASIY